MILVIFFFLEHDFFISKVVFRVNVIIMVKLGNTFSVYLNILIVEHLH